MKFSIIYEADIPMDHRVSSVEPPHRKLWQLTEQSDGEPSDWCGDIFDGKVKHRKWCGVLNEEQFDDFVRQCGVYPESVETMGSLGAPGFGFGWAPAISFRSDAPDAIQSAYVTPLACNKRGEPIRKSGATERDWERVKAVILRKYR